MVLFPPKEGEARAIKTWTPEDYARETKASKKQKTSWQDRGPSIPSSCGGLWRDQKFRPRPGQEGSEQKKPRWGNKGGKKHQKKKRKRLEAVLAAVHADDLDREQHNVDDDADDDDDDDDRLGDEETGVAIASAS